MIFYVIAALLYGFIAGAICVSLVSIDIKKSNPGEKAPVGVLLAILGLSLVWPLSIPLGILIS